MGDIVVAVFGTTVCRSVHTSPRPHSAFAPFSHSAPWRGPRPLLPDASPCWALQLKVFSVLSAPTAPCSLHWSPGLLGQDALSLFRNSNVQINHQRKGRAHQPGLGDLRLVYLHSTLGHPHTQPLENKTSESRNWPHTPVCSQASYITGPREP